ncbi:MAG: TonB family protein [Fibrobacter sp.]|nr:TonB family protein [Fibrobacter sp.]
MKYCILALFGLATLSMAAEPVFYELNDFLQGAKRNPNKCVNKGKTFKCVGYEEIEGAIFNTNTNHYYAYVRNSYSESYVEFTCDGFYVEDTDGVEKIVCGEVTTVKDVECNSLRSNIKISDYDELGILVDEKSVRNGDASLCRDAFHFQYGNDEGKDYAGLNVKNKENSAYSGRRGKIDGGFNEGYAEVGSGGVGDGFAGLLGGGGGGIATKAKGSIKTPSERDINMSGGSRSAADIMKVVRQRTPGLRHIYNKFLKHRPGFAGKVTLKFTIAPGGEIISISVASSTTGYKDFDDEIKLAVSHWKFNRVENGNTTVTIPFTFSE